VRKPSHILVISYEASLLHSRQLLLEHAGYRVTTALGSEEAMKQCLSGQDFDLFVLGHTIPTADKEKLVAAFGEKCPAPIVQLKRVGERIVPGVTQAIEPEPANVLATISEMLRRESSE
jgi:DNA-binding NtrC family response regulator